ncbi:MAG: GNAT family N-acetyltransferase [Deinococcales bacterium]
MAQIAVRPATQARWPDVERVLDQRGAVKGCWCMFFRSEPQAWRSHSGEENRLALGRLVEKGAAPGLLAYRDGVPVGWVSVAPREQFPRLDRSPISPRFDAQPVWALVCLYVPRPFRGAGVARALVRGAVAYARQRGAEIVEAYPVDDTLGPVSADHAYHGLVTLLRAERFEEVARRTARRPLMRLRLGAE